MAKNVREMKYAAFGLVAILCVIQGSDYFIEGINNSNFITLNGNNKSIQSSPTRTLPN